jgi:hypothetical protein
MKNIYRIDTMLSSEEKVYLLNLSNNIRDDDYNYNYNQVDKNLYLLDFQEKVKEFLKKNYPNTNYKFGNIWINKITPERTDSLEYHTDGSDLTIITYINSDFTGGDFEYILNNKVNKIKIEEDMCLVMDTPINHRISKVNSGIRYSLSFFLDFDFNKKTFI